MKLKVIQIKLDKPIDSNTKPIFSYGGVNTGVVGFFEHFSGLMYVPADALVRESVSPEEYFERIISEVDNIPTEHQLSFLIIHSTVFHEWCHYHHCFLTPLGIDLLERYCVISAFNLYFIQEIIGVRNMVSLQTPFPIINYLTMPECPNTLGELWKEQRQRQLQLSIDIGSEPLATIPGHDFENDFAVLHFNDMDYNKYEVPCVICNLMVDGKEYRSFWPIGFCLISECIAILIQGSHIASCGDEYRLEFRNLLKSNINPYTPLLGAMIRIFKSRGCNPHDDNIYKCLFHCMFAVKGKQKDNNSNETDCSSIGWELLDILENCVEIKHKKFFWKASSIDRSNWNDKKDFPQGMPFDLTNYIRKEYLSIAMQVSLPTLIEYDHPSTTLIFQGEFPPPPFMITSERELLISDQKFYQHWVNWMLIRQIIQDAFYHDNLNCPVRHSSTSWMFPKDGILPSADLCIKGLESSSCGVWTQNSVYRGADCMWTNYISEVLKPFGGRFAEDK